jgi:hypothetical protein
VSAWASSSYSGVLGPCSGDVIGNAVSYLPTIVGTLRRRVASLVVVIPLLGACSAGVESYSGDGQLILANAPSRRLTISLSVTPPAEAR